MIDVDVEFTVNGPLFTRDLAADFAQLTEDIVDVISAQTLAEVLTILNADIKQPTPYYETQVTRDNVSRTRDIVHDRGIIYGPWLEGVSPRNAATGFPGYHAFERATRRVEGAWQPLVQPTVTAFIAKLGG